MTDRGVEPLGDELARLAEAERAVPDPPFEARQRVLARLSATLGPPGGGGGGDEGSDLAGPTARASATAAGGLAKPLSLGLAFLLGGAVGAGVHAAVSGTVRTANAPVTLPVERVPAPSEPPVTTASTAPPATSVLAPAPSASAAPVLVASSRALSSADRPGHDLDLARERAALEVARTAIGRGQSASALQALAQHAREFPRGQLGEEREALWIQALLGSGQAAEARARAARFRARYPKSMMIPVLDALLEKSD